MVRAKTFYNFTFTIILDLVKVNLREKEFKITKKINFYHAIAIIAMFCITTVITERISTI